MDALDFPGGDDHAGCQDGHALRQQQNAGSGDRIIKAWDKSTQSVCGLSDSKLDNIELIDYDAPITKLADGWSYSANRNDVFANTATAPLKSFNLLPSFLEARHER